VGIGAGFVCRTQAIRGASGNGEILAAENRVGDALNVDTLSVKAVEAIDLTIRFIRQVLADGVTDTAHHSFTPSHVGHALHRVALGIFAVLI
jgi:hypothetical protein